MSRHTEDPALLLAAISTGAFLGAGGVLLYLNHRREELNKLEATITARDSELQKKVAELQKQLDDVRFHRVDSFSGLSFYSCDDDDTLVEDLRSDEEVVAVSENITNELHIPNGEIRPPEIGISESLPDVLELLESRCASDHTKAYTVLMQKDAKVADDYGLLGRACYKMAIDAQKCGDKNGHKEKITEGIEWCSEGLELDEDSAECHTWFAACVGSRSQFVSIKEKITDGFTFREHLEKAIALRPRDHLLHHMMGRFAFEVSQLSYLERRVAAALFANPPEATLDDALNHFILADEYAPFIWLENKLFIVKTLKLMKRNQKDIIAHLREANSVRDKLTDEVDEVRNELESFFKAYAVS